jgi:hypothetical protein
MKTYTRDELHEILEKHKMWLNNESGGERANFQEVSLQRANFQKANLWGADFQKANLWGADFQKADLREANFQKANLWGADFQKANLWEANFQKADLREANFQKANLWEADFQEADIDYSCWPLWCGSFDVKIDKRIAAQFACHFCRTICDDSEVIVAQTALLPLANQFHRVNECGEIKPMKARNEK